MSHAEQHRLIDLAESLPEDASPRLKQRRALFRQAGLAAFRRKRSTGSTLPAS